MTSTYKQNNIQTHAVADVHSECFVSAIKAALTIAVLARWVH